MIWAIQAHSKIDDTLSPNLREAASKLLSDKDIFQLNGGAVGLIPEKFQNQVFGKINAVLRPVRELENKIRGLVAQVNAPFAELERYAVLSGDPPKSRNSREIPRGRWVYHPDGYFVRYLPSGYSQTRVEVCVPERFVIERDTKGRITKVGRRDGSLIETTYNDSVTPLDTNTKGLRGYPFESIRVSVPNKSAPDGILTKEWRNTGWTLVGTSFDKSIRLSNSDGFAHAFTRIQAASELLQQLNDFKKQFGNSKNKGQWSGTENLIDLAHYRSGIEEVIRADATSPNGKTNILVRAWQFTFEQWASGQKAKHTTPAQSITDRNKQGLKLASFSARQLNPSIQPYVLPEFIPYDHTVIPGDTGRQRLGISIRPTKTGVSTKDGTGEGDSNEGESGADEGESEPGKEEGPKKGKDDIGEQIDEVLDDAILTDNGKTKQYEKPGGKDQAEEDFDKWGENNPVKDHGDGVRSVELPDGTTISIRPESGKQGEGPPTVQINRPTGRPIKIRYVP